MPAVTAIASAPQNATRIAAFIILAPPALAPTARSTTRNARDATDTKAVSNPVGDTSAISNGGAPPAENAVEADLIVDKQLEAGITGGSFPASDPPSAAQPSPSKYDEGTE